MSLLRAGVLAAVLLSPLTANAAAGVFILPNNQLPAGDVGLSVALDWRPDGIDDYVGLELPLGMRTEFAVVLPLPTRPDEVAVAPPGVLVALDSASSGMVLSCPSAGTSGCGSPAAQPGRGAKPLVADRVRLGTDRRPLVASAVATSTADAQAHLKAWGFDTSKGAEDLASVERDGFVLFLARFGPSVDPNTTGIPRAALRLSFKAAPVPFRIPLSFHPGLTNDVRLKLVTLSDAQRGKVKGVTVLPVAQAPVPSFLGGGVSSARVDRGNMDEVVRDTLNGQPGLVLETAQYLHQSDVAAQMPPCGFDEKDSDSAGCQLAPGCSNVDCGKPPPPPLPPDAGSDSDAGASDAASSDASVVPAEKSSGELPRLFPRDRFVTRFSMTGQLSQLSGTAAVSLEDSAEGVGPEYRHCPGQEQDQGCSSAPGPATLGLGWLLLAALLRRRTR